MQSIFAIALLTSLIGVVSVNAGPDWYNLRTTFSALPVTGFWAQPRTEEEAIEQDYKMISDCGDNHAFPGKRYIPYYSPENVVLIFDKNGYIAGIQSIVTKDTWNNGFQDVQNNPMYQPGTIKGEDVLLTTAYFVDPTTICSTGRTETEFKEEGTGYTLVFQNGKDVSSENLMEIPLRQSSLSNDKFWREHYCLFNMGTHYFNLNYDAEESCEKLFPVQLLYEEGSLHGFVWQHFGNLAGDLWEHPPKLAVGQIINTTPKCINDAIDTVGLSTMHIYFRNYLSVC